MATPPRTTPSLETQLDFLVHEIGTGNGGNLTTNSSWNSRNLTLRDATTLFENRFERSGGSNLNGRINFASRVFNAAQNGTLGSISSNVASSYDYLRSRGFSPVQAAGVVGNLMAESTTALDPAAFNPAGGGDGAFGIAQWRADRQRNLLNWDGEAIAASENFTPDENAPPVVNSSEDASELTGNQVIFKTAGGRSLYEDNVLNSFDSYTYGWAIHMVNPQFAQEFEENLNRNTYITIAESGVENEISIETVIQSNALTFARQNRSSVANTFDISLVEATGFTLFNRIILAAQELGIENYIEAAYLLELNFRGWDSNGSPVSEIVGPYYYMTVITNFQTRHSDSGTTYQVAFAETHQEAYNRLEFHLRSDITVTASNFGEFLTDFEQKVNDEAVKQTSLTLSKLYPTLYIFGTTEDANDWKSWGFDAIIGEQIQESRNISMSAAGGTITFNLTAGTAITAAIAAAVLQTRNFKRIPVGTNGQFAKDYLNSGTADAPKLAEIISWFSFTTEVAYKEFDPLSRQYQKQITYNIQPYLAIEGLHDPISFSQLNTDRNLQAKRIDNILRNGLLKKRFDYTFTGLNTEVLNLDLTFNNTFFSLQPINGGAIEGQGGYFNGLSATEADAVRAKNSYQAVQEQLRSLDRRLDQIGDERYAAIARRGIGDMDLITRLESERNVILSRRQSLTTRLINNAETAFDITDQLAELGRNTRANLSTTAQQYITQSDVFANSQRMDSIGRSMNFDYRSVGDSLAASGADLSDNVGTAMLGALELNLNAVESMVNQRIEIRGDPYWLGKPKGVSASNSNQANYSIGGVGYFLHVRFPTYEGDDGFINQSFTNFAITALFRVVTVTSTYSMGEFKQTLTSFRDVVTNVPMMVQQLLSGRIVNADTTSLQQRYTDNNNDGIDDVTGNQIPPESSTVIDTPATGGDTGVVSGDTAGLRTELTTALDQAAQETGVTAVVTSGVRGGGSNPSGRHNGSAADVSLYSNGRLLSVENPADLAIIQNYTQSYLNATRSAGLTPSVGVGNPAYGTGSGLYMSGTAFHYDVSRTQGYANLSPNAGPYWGGSGSTSGHATPTWLVNMYNS